MTSAVPSSSSRRRGRRAALTGVLAGALIAGGTVVATTMAAPAGANPYKSMITLDTAVTTDQLASYSSTGAVTYNTLTPTSSSNCSITTPPTVLGITSAPKDVGLRDGSIGVTDKTSGEACGQANASAGEVLTLTIPTVTASRAVLDLELQQDAVVLATIKDSLTDTTPVVIELQTGRNISRNATPITSGATAIGCQVRSSSGPNSSSADNCRWIITQPFIKSIELKAIRGNFSLEGGADGRAASSVGGTEPINGVPNSQTYFVLNGQLPLNCATTGVTAMGSATTPTVTIRNISTSSGDPCQGFAYSLTTSGGKASFIKPYSEQSQRLQFMMDLEWQIPANSVAELPKILFGFHDINLNEGPAVELGWCTNPVFDSAGLVTGLTTPPTATMEQQFFPAYFNNASYPGIQYACMGNPELKRDSNNKPIGWFQSIYVHGDAFARRP